MFENPLDQVNKFNSYLAKQTEEEKQRKLKQQAYNTQQKQSLAPTFSKDMIDAPDRQQYESAGIRPLTAKEKMNINAPYSKSEKFPTLTKQDENFIMSKAGGDPVKATDVYRMFMEAKSARDFVEARDGQRNELVYKASQEKDPERKSKYELIIKGSQLADIARKERLKEGFNDVSQVNDEQILTNLLKTPEAQAGFTKYINNQIVLDDMTEIIDPGYTTRNKPVLLDNTTQKEQEKVDGTVLGDIAGGIAKSGTASAEIGSNIGDWLGYNIIKATMGEEAANKAKERMGASFGETIDKTLTGLGVDQDSFAYNAGKFAGDTAQISAGGAVLKTIPAVAKGIQAIDAVGKTSKGGKVGKAIAKVGKAIAKGAIQGATDTAMYDAIANKELVSGKELAIGGAIGGGATAVGIGLSKAADAIKSKLQLSGTLNVKELRKAARTLGEEKDVDNVAQWMLDRKVTGGLETQVDKLANIADDSFAQTTKALSKSKSLHVVNEATAALKKIKGALGGTEAVGGLEKEYDEVVKLLNKSTKKGLSLSDLNKVQKLQSEYLPNFTTSNLPADTVQAKANVNLYMKVKNFIEKTAEKEGLGNIKEMKKNTQIAMLLKDALSKKISNQSASSLASLYGTTGVGMIGGAVSGPSIVEDPVGFIGRTLAGAVAGGIIQNKAVQTAIASGINKMTKQEATAVAQLLEGLIRGGTAEAATEIGTK